MYRLDKQAVADYNRARVFHLLLNEAPINRSEIASRLKLSIPTVMKIVDNFMDEGILYIEGKGESTGGAKPNLYDLVRDAYYCVGLDVGRSKLNIILTNLKGEIVYKNVTGTGHLHDTNEFIQLIIDEIEKSIRTTKVPNNKIMGIGIGVPGIIDKDSGKILFSPNFSWKNVDMVTPLKERFGFQVMIENSNRTMALGEKWFGVGKNSDLTLCINVGQGIGAAILSKDDIYYGSSGTSGELGHMILEKEGPLCECGNNGCLQALSSGNAIAKRMNKNNAKEVFDMARDRDVRANEVIHEAMDYLAIGIASAINVLDPDLVILSGGVMKSKDFFEEELLHNIYEYRMEHTGRNVKIKICTNEDSTALGAVVLLLKSFRNNGVQIK